MLRDVARGEAEMDDVEGRMGSGHLANLESPRTTPPPRIPYAILCFRWGVAKRALRTTARARP